MRLVWSNCCCPKHHLDCRHASDHVHGDCGCCGCGCSFDGSVATGSGSTLPPPGWHGDGLKIRTRAAPAGMQRGHFAISGDERLPSWRQWLPIGGAASCNEVEVRSKWTDGRICRLRRQWGASGGGDGQAISCRFFSLAPALHRAISRYKTAHPNDEDEEAEEHGEFSEGRNNLLRERYRIASRV